LILRIYLIFIFFNNWMYSLTDVSYEIVLLGWQSMWFWFSLIDIKFELKFLIIVFRPGLVQGPGSGFWSGHRIARVNFFFKSKRRYFSKKTKVNELQPGFWPDLAGSSGQPAGSHRVFPFPIFSSSRPGSSPGSTCQAEPGFKTIFLRELYKFG
jgi:hypothetical protein